MADATPDLAIILVEPGTVAWRKTPLFRPFFMKWLSEGIAVLDNGPFSHSVLRNGDSVIDARLRKPAVLKTPYLSLVCTGRGLSFMAHQSDGDQAVVDAWNNVKSRFPAPESEEPEPEPEPNRFSFLGLLRIGILLVIEREGWPGAVGRWLVARHQDDPGMFCSELVASALVESGHELVVTVPAGRIPPKDSRAEAALLGLLTARREINMPGNADPIEAVTEAFAAQLDRLRAPTEAALKEVPVGGPDRERDTYPPSLVTPNDLFRSRSLEFCVNEDGSTDAPQLSPEELAKRYRTWKGVTAVVASVAATALAFVGGWVLSRSAGKTLER